MSIRFNFNTPVRAINELTRLLPPRPPKKIKKIATQSSTLLEIPPFFSSPSRKGIFFSAPLRNNPDIKSAETTPSTVTFEAPHRKSHLLGTGCVDIKWNVPYMSSGHREERKKKVVLKLKTQ